MFKFMVYIMGMQENVESPKIVKAVKTDIAAWHTTMFLMYVN